MFTTFKPIYDFKFEMILFRLVHYYNIKKRFFKKKFSFNEIFIFW